MPVGNIEKNLSSGSKGIEVCEDHDKTSGKYIYIYNHELHKHVHIAYLSTRAVKVEVRYAISFEFTC